MKSPFNFQLKPIHRLLILLAALAALTALPLLAHARSQMASIRVVNNSSREIRHVYLSSVAEDNWSADQLGEGAIRSGESYTLSNVSCSGSNVKVIAEDQNGCFVSAVVACGGDAEWTITNADAPNCGN